jgi:hypothetical protein
MPKLGADNGPDALLPCDFNESDGAIKPVCVGQR